MNIKRILIAGIVVWLVEFVIGALTCGWLFNWVYKLPPNIWKTSINMIGMNIVGIIRAMMFVLVFAIFYKGIPGKGAKKGIVYGLLIWLVGALPGLAGMPFYMTIANTVVIYWLIQCLILSLLTGAIIGVIYKEK